MRISWGVAEAPMVAGTESGDSHIVRQLPEGVLAAVIDGVGHGNEAADAARIAGRTLTSSPHEDTVSLVWRCHEALKETRGVVMTLLFFSLSGAMTWVGVGNVEGVIFRCDASGRTRANHVVLRGGVIGHRLPPLRAESLTLLPHDTVILATDGIRPEFSDEFVPRDEPQAIADQILTRYRKGTDDALVLVVRCLGDQS
ncbi:MAG TPA: SpoIIE family protein phosphatase [Vicinamibacterales bacterium]|nr:SpoIIE family protein phosphatase [Vicinamibacterales bacterium]